MGSGEQGDRGRLAVVVTLYNRPQNHDRIIGALEEQSRPPDELWFVSENVETHLDLVGKIGTKVLAPWQTAIVHPTPLGPDGRYGLIPYSLKTNIVLDVTSADYIAYLTDDSLPHPDKYLLMAAALDEHPEWGVVYCSQVFSGANGAGARMATAPMEDAYCNVDHTQVMHRLTEDRWDTDMAHVRLGDALFWRKLHKRFGPFQPVEPLLDAVEQFPDGLTRY